MSFHWIACPSLEKIGEIFMNVGMCSQSVDAYLKCDAVQLAAEVCVKLNEWDRALQLASQYKTNVQILQLFEKHVHQLLQKGKTLDTIQLYRKAERYLEAAELLFDFAKDRSKKCPPILMKKMFVLVALLVENYVKYTKEKSKSEGNRAKTIGGIDVDSIRSIKLLDNPWHYAEAYHLLMLSQLQMMNGSVQSALKIAVRLPNYDDILDPLQIYSIITTCAICCKSYGIASKAFTELETIPSERQKEYELMALSLFRTPSAITTHLKKI